MFKKLTQHQRTVLVLFAVVALALAVVAFAVAPVASAQDAYPESLQEWVDGGKYVEFEGLEIFVHASG